MNAIGNPHDHKAELDANKVPKMIEVRLEPLVLNSCSLSRRSLSRRTLHPPSSRKSRALKTTW